MFYYPKDVDGIGRINNLEPISSGTKVTIASEESEIENQSLRLHRQVRVMVESGKFKGQGGTIRRNNLRPVK